MTQSIIDTLATQYAQKKVLIVGLGLQGGGVGIASFFAKLGSYVTVTDLKTEDRLASSIDQLKDFDIQYVLGEHRKDDFLTADIIFKAPKMRWDAPEIQAALEKNIPVEMEISFFMKHCPAPIIGITGSRGKSTTTQMIYELLKTNKKSVFLGGNVSHISTIQLLNQLTPSDFVVLELSSWQLSALHHAKISPHMAVFTSFYPDHLDYYTSIEEYWNDKKAIYAYQKDTDVLIAQEALKDKILADHPLSQTFFIAQDEFPTKLEYLHGEHNGENAALAFEVSKLLKLDNDIALSTIAHFKGLPYRQQMIGEKDNVFFINDTTSTTPIATIKAIHSFSDAPIVLLLGGNSKNLPSDELVNELSHVQGIVLLEGSFTKEILPVLQEKYADKILGTYGQLEQAVNKAYDAAKQLVPSGKVYVLFSPGATSFAMFNNEFHRGDTFNQLARHLINS